MFGGINEQFDQWHQTLHDLLNEDVVVERASSGMKLAMSLSERIEKLCEILLCFLMQNIGW